MACCVVTAFFINQIIKALDTLDLKIIEIKYNDFDDPVLMQEQPQCSIQTTRLRLSGLTCAACVHTVESAVKKLDGVERVSVSLALCRATIAHDANRATHTDLENAVRMAGYEAIIGDRSVEENLEVLERVEEMQRLRASFSAAVMGSTLLFSLDSVTRFLPISLGSQNDLVVFSIQLLLAGYVLVYNAWWIHERAWVRSGWRLKSNMDTLISCSLILSLLVSVFNVWLVGSKVAQTYFVTGSFLTTVISAGRYLDLVLRRKSAANLAQLYRLQNESMMVKLRKTGTYVPASLLQVDEEIIVEPMTVILCDCFILEGTTTVDEATMTGEAIPATKKVGDLLMSGTKNISRQVVAIVTTEQENSSLARLTESIAAATEETTERPGYEGVVMEWFVISILTLAVVCFAITFNMSYGSPVERLNTAAQRAMAVLAAACPCAFGLATPSATAAGIDAAWASGIILMGGEKTLKALTSLTHMVLDKTGTLTEGRLNVVKWAWERQWSLDQVCEMLYLAEKEAAQSHPAGRAVFQWALNQLASDQRTRLGDAKLANRADTHGKGISCTICLPNGGQHTVHVGSLSFLQDSGIRHSAIEVTEGSSIVYFGFDTRYAGHLVLQDTIRKEAPSTIRELKDNNLALSMLTGDTHEVAARVSTSLGIPVLSARSLPHEKQAWIKSLQDKGAKVAMIGDGINDSLAQATADVGILLSLSRACMTGAADVIIMNPSLDALPKMLEIAKRTVAQARTNIRWTIGYNAISVSLASGLFQRWGIVINASFAGMLMALSSLTILSMSLLLRRSLSHIHN